MANQQPFTRREVLRSAAAAGLTAVAGNVLAQQAPVLTTQKSTPMIGIQMSLGPLAKGDLNKLFDDLQQRAGVNSLFPFIYGYVPEWADVPAAGYLGGNYAIPHMQYYKDTKLTYEQMRAPEFGDLDLLERITTGGAKRGIKTYAWILEHNRPTIPRGWDRFYEVDFKGRPARTHPAGPCYNNPEYRGFVLGLAEDYARSYDVAGVMWSSERQGGLWNALGAWHHGDDADPGKATCFCEFCQKRARDGNIDIDRAKQGFAALEQFVRDGRSNKKPRDGYFVTFMRILLKYPQLLQWETLWMDSRKNLMVDIRNRVRSAKPGMPVGWHIWHNVSFSPFHRAEVDYAEYAAFSDYIKPVLYSNSAGERIKSFADSVGGNVFGDLPGPELLDMLYKMLDYPNEAPYDKVTATGLTADYVERETRRTVDDVAGADHKVEVWPGIDVDVPVPAGASKCTPEGIKQTVISAFKGGASGLVISRNYSEMKPENLAGVGAGLRELGLI